MILWEATDPCITRNTLFSYTKGWKLLLSEVFSNPNYQNVFATMGAESSPRHFVGCGSREASFTFPSAVGVSILSVFNCLAPNWLSASRHTLLPPPPGCSLLTVGVTPYTWNCRQNTKELNDENRTFDDELMMMLMMMMMTDDGKRFMTDCNMVSHRPNDQLSCMRWRCV